jgi:hypothetical protein
MSCQREINCAATAGQASGGVPETTGKSAAADGRAKWKKRAKTAALVTGCAAAVTAGYFGTSQLATKLTVSQHRTGVESLKKAIDTLETVREGPSGLDRTRLMKEGEALARASLRKFRIADCTNAVVNTLGCIRGRKPIHLDARGPAVAANVLHAFQKLRRADQVGAA